MRVSLSEAQGWGVVQFLVDRFDAHVAKEAEEVLQRAILHYPHVVVNLEATDSISSAGLRVLLSVQRKAQQEGKALALAGLRDHVQEVFDIAGLLPFFQIFPSWEEALRAGPFVSTASPSLGQE